MLRTTPSTGRPFLLIMAGKIRLTDEEGEGEGGGRRRQRHGASTLRDEAMGGSLVLAPWLLPLANRPHSQVQVPPPPCHSALIGRLQERALQFAFSVKLDRMSKQSSLEVGHSSRNHSISSVLFRPASFFLLSFPLTQHTPNSTIVSRTD